MFMDEKSLLLHQHQQQQHLAYEQNLNCVLALQNITESKLLKWLKPDRAIVFNEHP